MGVPAHSTSAAIVCALHYVMMWKRRFGSAFRTVRHTRVRVGGETTVYLCRVQEEIGDTRAEDVPVLLSHVCEADPGRNLLAGLHRRSSEQVFLACGGETQQPENAPRNLAEDA